MSASAGARLELCVMVPAAKERVATVVEDEVGKMPRTLLQARRASIVADVCGAVQAGCDVAN